VRKAVLDTNVYISALLTKGGGAEQAWLRAVQGEMAVYASVPILTEVARKLRGKFHWEDQEIRAAIGHLADVARIVKPARKRSILADGPDNRILECAEQANAEIIVTGDRHLLDLGSFEGIRVMKIATFLDSVL